MSMYHVSYACVLANEIKLEVSWQWKYTNYDIPTKKSLNSLRSKHCTTKSNLDAGTCRWLRLSNKTTPRFSILSGVHKKSLCWHLHVIHICTRFNWWFLCWFLLSVEPHLWSCIPGCDYSVLLLRRNASWFLCDRDIFRRLGPKEMHLRIQRCYGKLIKETMLRCEIALNDFLK